MNKTKKYSNVVKMERDFWIKFFNFEVSLKVG